MGETIQWEELKEKIDERKKEIKKEDFLKKAKTKIKEGVDWVKENPDKVTAIATATLVMVKAINKVSSKAHDWHHRECTQWDPSSRQQLTLRRPMTSREKAIFAERIAYGDKTYDILNDMNLIRR